MHSSKQIPEKIAYTISEARHASGLSRSTLYELIAEGKLAAMKVGGRRLIPATSLRQLLQPVSGSKAGSA